MDTHLRSVLKAVSYRIIGTFTTAGILWVLTGKAGFAATVGIADTVIKIGIYILHERVWDNLRFGRIAAPEYEI